VQRADANLRCNHAYMPAARSYVCRLAWRDCERLRQAAAPALGALQRRKPARNCLERSALLQTIAVLIAACALTRLVLACYEESGLARLLTARRACRACPAGPCGALAAVAGSEAHVSLSGQAVAWSCWSPLLCEVRLPRSVRPGGWLHRCSLAAPG